MVLTSIKVDKKKCGRMHTSAGKVFRIRHAELTEINLHAFVANKINCFDFRGAESARWRGKKKQSTKVPE